MEPERGRISTAYRRLAGVAGALGGALDARAAGQDMLDVLAVLDGLKPVLLAGRGAGDERWTAGLLGVAQSFGLAVVEGAYWNARPPTDAPGWYADHVAGEMAAGRAWYVTASDQTADELRALCAAGRSPDVATEARLLGYPECCVAAHYNRAEAWHRLTLAVLARRAGGDEAAMRALLAEGTAIEPETAEEEALHAMATGFAPCPFTSWNVCPACAADADSVSARLSARYRALAERVDPQLAALLDGRV